MEKKDKTKILEYIENLKTAQSNREIRNFEKKILEVVEETSQTSKKQVSYKKGKK